MYICSTASEHHEWMKESSMQHVSSASALNYYWRPQTKKQATQSNPESTDVMPCNAMQKHRMNKKLVAAATEEEEMIPIQSNQIQARGGVNRLIIPVHEQIEQVDHQMHLYLKWWLARTLVRNHYSILFPEISEKLYIDPIRAEFRWIPSSVSASALNLAFIVESSVRCHYSSVGLLACSSEKAASSPENTCMHAWCTYKTVAGDGSM